MNREYDLIIFGASGFTGKLISSYIASHKDTPNIKWAIAGRDRNKVTEIAEKYSVDAIIADSFDLESLDSMSKKTKLVITTVGPYSIYGENLIYSCIQNGTHCLDLTGEPDFVTSISKKYKHLATENNSIIIHCCGLESIPADIGAYETVKLMDGEKKDLTFYLKTKGQISGGTWASFLNSISNPKTSIIQSKSKSNRKTKKLFYSKRFKKWALIFPVIDKYIVMKSSRGSKEYGKQFSFNQYVLQKSLFSTIVLVSSIFLVGLVARFTPIRNKLINLIPSGTGPSKEKREKNWFDITVIGKQGNMEAITTIKGGDPGYGETSKFISEMALCILTNYEELNRKKGILTPIECAGSLITNRLIDNNISINSNKVEINEKSSN